MFSYTHQNCIWVQQRPNLSLGSRVPPYNCPCAYTHFICASDSCLVLDYVRVIIFIFIIIIIIIIARRRDHYARTASCQIYCTILIWYDCTSLRYDFQFPTTVL